MVHYWLLLRGQFKWNLYFSNKRIVFSTQQIIKPFILLFHQLIVIYLLGNPMSNQQQVILCHHLGFTKFGTQVVSIKKNTNFYMLSSFEVYIRHMSIFKYYKNVRITSLNIENVSHLIKWEKWDRSHFFNSFHKLSTDIHTIRHKGNFKTNTKIFKSTLSKLLKHFG